MLQAEVVPGLTLDMDSHQVQQALLNLAMNAVEASPPGGMVLLRGRRQDETTVVEIENSAAPIPHDIAVRIFEPFFTTKPGGTGLGLAIARNIARAHGGDIQLTANASGHIRFTLTLPPATLAARRKA